jgi:hypothetical protein
MTHRKGNISRVAMIPFTFENLGSNDVKTGVFDSLETLQRAYRERKGKTEGRDRGRSHER